MARKVDFGKTTPDVAPSPYACDVCKDEGSIGTGFTDPPVDILDSMPCPRCGGMTDDEEAEYDPAIRERYPDWQ